MEALPIGGAILGGVAGSFIGMPQLGMSIGWMVGSWVYNATAESKNEIFDPGVQELPKINQALRGTLLPVVFGTNRVSSQIVWQDNFNTIRTEQGSGGGKGGGSSGGKVPEQTSVSYRYKWDLIYHLGMVPEPYSLFGGWLGGQRLHPSVIQAIHSGTNSNFSPLTSLLIQTTSNAAGEIASVTFDDAIWWAGGNQEEGWARLASSVGFPIRWPNTCYVGLQQIDLGSNPHIPQLTWEVGPGSFDATCGIETVESVTLDSGEGQDHIPNIAADKYGRTYNNENSTALSPMIICTDDNQIIWRLTATEIKDRWVAAYSLSISSISKPRVAIIDPEDGEERILIFGIWDNGSEFLIGCEVCALTPDGTIGAPSTGSFVFVEIGLDLGNICQNVQLVRMGNLLLFNEHIIFYFEPNSTLLARMVILPPLSQILSGLFNNGYTAGTHVWADYEVPYFRWELSTNSRYIWCNGAQLASYSDYSGTSPTGFYLEHLSADPLLPSYELYHYRLVSKSAMRHHADAGVPSIQKNPYVRDTLQPAYPDGCIVRVLMTIQESYHVWDALLGSDNGAIIDTLADPTVVNSEFINGVGSEIIPWDDAHTILSTEADDTIHFFDYVEKPYIYRIPGGLIVLIWSGLARNLTDSVFASGQVQAKVRAILFNPSTATGEQIAELQCGAGTQADGWKAYPASPTKFATTLVAAVVRNETQLYLHCLNDDQVIVVEWGTLLISSGGDVYPPYIIKEILTNAVFGIGINPSLINDASYDAALLHCVNNDLKVSVQYRREENILSLVEELLEVYAGYIIISDGKIKFGVIDGISPAVRTIDNNHFIIKQPGEPPVKVTRVAPQDTYNKVRVNFFDRSLDYQQNQVELADEPDQDLTGTRMREFAPKFVMSTKLARTIAARALWTNRSAPEIYTFGLGWKDADLEPGDVITLVDSYHNSLQSGEKARIVNWVEQDRGRFNVTAVQELDYLAASSQQVFDISSPINFNPIGPAPNILSQVVYELPAEYIISNPSVFAAYVPDAFASGAALHISPDGITYSAFESVSPLPIGGTLLTNLNSDRRFVEGPEIILFPNSNWLSNSPTYVYSTTLAAVSDAGRASGAGLLWVGSEMLSYEGVNLVSQNRYKFDRLHRGWGGTHIHNHNSGDYFIKHGGGIFAVPYNENQIGNKVYVKIVPYNFSGAGPNIASLTATEYTIQGAYYRPQVAQTPRLVVGSVEHRGLTKLNIGVGSSIALDWRDSAREKGFGVSGYGVGEFGRFTTDVLSHNWRVEIVGSGSLVVRSLEVSTTTYTYPGSSNISDNGAWRGNIAVKVTPFGEHGDAPRTDVISLELF